MRDFLWLLLFWQFGAGFWAGVAGFYGMSWWLAGAAILGAGIGAASTVGSLRRAGDRHPGG